MAKEAIRMPPDIIRAIEVSAAKGPTVEVKYDRGVWKVQEKRITLVLAREV